LPTKLESLETFSSAAIRMPFFILALFVLAVILSAAKDPGTISSTDTARTFQPKNRMPENRMPHPRDGLIVAKVGLVCASKRPHSHKTHPNTSR
jgi:hypothetical protein